MSSVPPERPRVDLTAERIRRGLGEPAALAAAPIDVGGGGPHPPGMDTLSTSLGARIDAQSAQTRQELVGIANAISNSITAARQVQPQIVIVPTPVPGAPPTASNPRSKP